MRRLPCLPLAPRCAASTALAAVRLQSQSSRPYGRGAGGGGGVRGGSFRGRGGGNYGNYGYNNIGASAGGSNSGAPRAEGPSAIMNKTNDGELTFGTRVAMRDDSIILTEIFKHLPPKGAISLKSLFSALNADVQEALCEKHDGLRSFIEERKQIFTMRPNPADGVLYVVGNSLVAQQFATRDAQLRTMRSMMGLDQNGGYADPQLPQQQQQRRPNSNFGGRGRGGGSGGGGNGNYSSSSSNNRGRGRGDGRSEDQRQRRYSGGGGGSSNTDNFTPRGGVGGQGGDGRQYSRAPSFGSQQRPYGNRN